MEVGIGVLREVCVGYFRGLKKGMVGFFMGELRKVV